MYENVSVIHQSAFSALCMTKWRNYLLLDLKLLLGVQSKINNKVCRTSSEETWHFFTFSGVWTQRKGGEIRSKAKFIRRVWSAWLWMKSIVLPNETVQATTRSFSFSSFSCVVFSWLSQFQLCHFNVGRFTSSVWNFWRWIRVSHVVAGANERRLYSQATAPGKLLIVINFNFYWYWLKA